MWKDFARGFADDCSWRTIGEITGMIFSVSAPIFLLIICICCLVIVAEMLWAPKNRYQNRRRRRV